MRHQRNLTTERTARAIAVMTLLSVATAYAATPADIEFFETRVRPILAEHCYACHGPEKQRSNLRWDHIEFALTGGERGPALVPGDPAKSRMIEAISYANRDLRMPPTGKLPEATIATLRDWIKRGAPWPDEPKPAAENQSERFDLEARWANHW